MRRRPRHMVPILLLQHVNISSAFPLNFTELQFLINLSMIIELLILCHAYNFISDFFFQKYYLVWISNLRSSAERTILFSKEEISINNFEIFQLLLKVQKLESGKFEKISSSNIFFVKLRKKGKMKK